MAGNATAQNSMGSLLLVGNPPTDNGILLDMATFAAGKTSLAQVVAALNMEELGEVIEMPSGGIKFSKTKTSHLKNTWEQKVPGRGDAGDFTARLNYAEAVYANLMALVPGGTSAPRVAPAWGRLSWARVFSDGSFRLDVGFIAGVSDPIPDDDRTVLEINVELSGTPVFFEVE